MNQKVFHPLSFLIISGTDRAGGAEVFVERILDKLDPNTFSKHLCLLRSTNRVRYNSSVSVKILHHHNELYLIRTIFRLIRLLRQVKPTLVLCTTADITRKTALSLFFTKKNFCWIARIASNPRWGGRGKIRGLLYLSIDRWVYTKVDHCVVNGLDCAIAFGTIHAIASEKVRVVRNIFDFDAIDALSLKEPLIQRSSSHIYSLISVGRLHKAKRFDLLIEAMAIVTKEIACECLICGDGYLRNELQRKIKKYKVETSVKLIGYVENPYSLMRQSDLFILCSEYEGMPNALIEAMGIGCVCIATQCEYGPQELIDHGYNGYLCSITSRSIAHTILHVLQDESRKSVGNTAKSSIRKVYAQSQSLYEWKSYLLQCAMEKV